MGGELGKFELLRELLDAGDARASKAHKDGFGRWLAVNPVLDVVAFLVALANFVFGFADSGDYFFPSMPTTGLLS